MLNYQRVDIVLSGYLTYGKSPFAIGKPSINGPFPMAGGFNPSEKYEFVNGVGIIPYMENYFTSSDPHHDISKQLVDNTFV